MDMNMAEIIRDEIIRDTVGDLCDENDINKAIASVVQDTFLVKVLRPPSEADEAIKNLYSSWDTLEALAVLSARLIALDQDSFLLGMANEYLKVLKGTHLGNDVNVLTNIGEISDRPELIALIALYFYGTK